MEQFAQERLRPLKLGIILSFLALLHGFGLGAVFGAAESSIKGTLNDSAQAVLATKYGGDQAKADAVAKKSWTYMKRSHLHAGVLGAASLVLILLLALLEVPGVQTKTVAFLLGFGAFVYGLYWMLAAFASPGLGSTGAGKGAYNWVSIPGSAACIFGLLGTMALTLKSLLRKNA